MNMSPLYLSLQISILATCIVMITGIFLARLLSVRTFKGKLVIESIIMLPMVLPPTVVGFGLLFLFGKNGLFGGLLLNWFDFQLIFTWYAAVLAAVVVSFPLMYQSAAAAFQKHDRNLEHAAYTMGASKRKVFWTISLPLAWPGILAGIVLSFARALGEFGATLMIAGYIPGKTDTLPLAIYFSVEAGDNEQAFIWVILMLSFGFLAIYWLNRWNGKNSIGFNKK
ncbi:molybdate ABC transporter permease subunit [Aquibacillus sp. 3ASR75-11]|uniref:Molybdenum transport system permease n=1 Tax=Terrihalobacillus insolitus TaxID=2950438 RepID=A0A9X3WWN0_9BACI|nr:molybdate ABC transporter permease subunit [Terrihalobacillus insolitus]MDC3413559.1 molybdate ABC transporter permease subunit [Terrihalobacillus insolitus]MDC3424684.1 molybdate ABC transporter permease subunit [Terrihalobacillus insolitus]